MIYEILRYRLRSGSQASFAAIMKDQSEPLHAEAGIAIVFHGATHGDPQGYVLVRKFDDVATMDSQLDQFYASAAWRDGPRQAIIDAIENSERIVANSI